MLRGMGGFREWRVYVEGMRRNGKMGWMNEILAAEPRPLLTPPQHGTSTSRAHRKPCLTAALADTRLMYYTKSPLS